jgi:hypothetical protein
LNTRYTLRSRRSFNAGLRNTPPARAGLAALVIGLAAGIGVGAIVADKTPLADPQA